MTLRLQTKPREAIATLAEYEMYMSSINEMENRIIDDTKFPVVRDNKIKTCCYATLELLKIGINYLKVNIRDASKKKT